MPSRKYHRRTFSSALPEGSRVLVYCRYSGVLQDDRSQRMALEDAIRTNGWQLVEWFQDDARGGSSDQRPGWQDLIARAHEQPRPADGVVAWKGDRISRDQLDASYYKADLRRRGYTLHFLADELPDGPMQPLFESLLQWKAEQDLRDISANTIRGQQTVARLEVEVDGRVQRGFSAGGFPPRGYRFAAPVRTGVRRNGEARYNRRYEPDPALWATCRRAVELLLAGRSYAEICRETGLFRRPGALSSWLRADALYGRRRHGETTVEDAHERLVTAREEPLVLARLDAGLRRQARVHPRRVASGYLLSGLLRCGYCVEAGREGGMQGHESRSGRWYRCAYRHAGGACPQVMVPADDAERLVVEAVLGTLTFDYFRPAIAAVRAAALEQLAARSAHLEQAGAEAGRLERQRRNLVRALSDEYSPALRDELRRVEASCQQVQRQRAPGPGAQPLSDEEVEAYLETLRAAIREGGDVPQRRRALATVVRRVLAFPGRLALEPGIVDHPPAAVGM